MKINTSKIKGIQGVSLVVIFASIALMMYSTKCGLGITHDSVTYIKGGVVLANGGHFMTPDYPKNIVPNGPLLPLLLSVLGLKAVYYYKWLTVLFLLITLLSFRYITSKSIENSYLQLWVITAVCLGTPLFMVFNFLWTEAFFIALFSLVLVYTYKYEESSNPNFLIAIGVLGFLLTTLRMAGILFPVVIFFMIFMGNRKVMVHPKFIVGALFPVVGFLLWRVYLLSFEGGVEKMTPPEEVVHLYKFQIDYLSSLGLWFLPLFVNENLRALLAVVLATLAGVLIYFKRAEISPKTMTYLKLLLACSVFYYGARSILERELDQIDRYLSEIYPLALLILGVVADTFYRNITKAKKAIFLITLYLWLLYPVVRTIKNAVFWNHKFCTEHSLKF